MTIYKYHDNVDTDVIIPARSRSIIKMLFVTIFIGMFLLLNILTVEAGIWNFCETEECNGYVGYCDDCIRSGDFFFVLMILAITWPFILIILLILFMFGVTLAVLITIYFIIRHQKRTNFVSNERI